MTAMCCRAGDTTALAATRFEMDYCDPSIGRNESRLEMLIELPNAKPFELLYSLNDFIQVLPYRDPERYDCRHEQICGRDPQSSSTSLRHYKRRRLVGILRVGEVR